MQIPQQMKAMAVDAFGGPDQLTLHEMPAPAVGPGDVMIRVECAGVGVWDAMEREGKLETMKPQPGPFPLILGAESAGTVVAVGEGVGRYEVGQRVYVQSFLNPKGGSYAQLVAVPEKSVARLPDGMSLEMAGGFAVAGVTALSNLKALATGDEDKLMIWGASGGVGHVALQLAKRMGARVFAIASGADGVELCQSLGADEAIDGHGDDVMERARAFAPDGFDSALITVGGDEVQATLDLVRQGGIISYPNGVMPVPVAPDGVKLVQANGVADELLLDQLNTLAGIGDFRVHIAQTFPLEEAARAQEALDEHFVGKIVLRVD